MKFHPCLHHSPFSAGIESCSATHTDLADRLSCRSQSSSSPSVHSFLTKRTKGDNSHDRGREGRKEALFLCISCSSEALNEMIAVLCPPRQASKKLSALAKCEQLARPPDARDFLQNSHNLAEGFFSLAPSLPSLSFAFKLENIREKCSNLPSSPPLLGCHFARATSVRGRGRGCGVHGFQHVNSERLQTE